MTDMTTPIDCERCGADITNDPEMDAWMCGNCVQLEEEYYADAAAQEEAKPATGMILVDEIRTGDIFLNQYGQLLWIANADAPPAESKATHVSINVVMPTGERFTLNYPEDTRYQATLYGPHRILRTPERNLLP